MATVRAIHRPVLVTELLNCLGVGGTERQLVEQLRRLDTEYFAAELFCLQKVGELLEDVRALSLEPTELSLRGSLLNPNTILQALRLARHMKQRGTRLLHTHDFYSNLLGSAAARLAGVPHIVSRRDLGAWIDWKRAAVLAAVTRNAPYVLCNAYAVRDLLVNEERIPSERITVIHNGIDLDRFDQAAARGPNPPLMTGRGEGPVIVLVGNMKHAVKGHADMLRAASAVLRTLPQVRFLFIGDGALRPQLERQVHEMGIEHAFTFAGKRTDVPALLARCHIAVSASHSEGLSNAVMEAMASRLPVVATSVGGNVELVRDGRTGFLVRRGDPVDLAQRLVELARHPALTRRLGLAGRRRMEEEFASSIMGERLNELYARILLVQRGQRRAA